MVRIEQIAKAALEGDALRTRALWADLLSSTQSAGAIARPSTDDPLILALSASLAELLAERRGQMPPSWTVEVEAPSETRYLITVKTEHKRQQLRKATPASLARRNFFASPNYLLSA